MKNKFAIIRRKYQYKKNTFYYYIDYNINFIYYYEVGKTYTSNEVDFMDIKPILPNGKKVKFVLLISLIEIILYARNLRIK